MKKTDFLNILFNVPITKGKKDFLYKKKKTFKLLFTDSFISKEEDINEGFFYQTGKGYFTGVGSNKPVKITDAPTNKRLFNLDEEIIVDSRLLGYPLKEPITSTFGRLLSNRILLFDVLGTNAIYFNRQMDIVKDIEKLYARLFSEDIIPKEKIDEYRLNIRYLEGLSDLITITATVKNIQPPPGIEEYKKKLIDEKGGVITDSKSGLEVEEKLLAYQEAYLADDPSNNIFMDSKIKGNSKKKTDLVIGSEAGFNNTRAKFNPSSLSSGLDKDKDLFTGSMNNLRSGAYSKASETQISGVMAKVLITSTSLYKITEKNCNSKEGLEIAITDFNYELFLVGSYIILDNDIKLVKNKEEAKSYIGKVVKKRSPMYCKTESDMDVCMYCIGYNYRHKLTALLNGVTNIGAVLATMNLKKMHNDNTSRIPIGNINDLII